MDIITGSTGTNHVTSADDRALHAGMAGLGNYVLNIGNKLAANINSSNIVRIGSGDILLNGCHARIRYGDYEDVSFNSTGSDGMKRIDLIVARYKRVGNIESVTLEVIEGTPSANPVAPTDEYAGKSIIENETIADMVLYEVTIDGYAVVSTASKFSVLNTLAEVSKKTNDTNKIANEARKIATNGFVLSELLTITVDAVIGQAAFDIQEDTSFCIPVLINQSEVAESFFVKRAMVNMESKKATLNVEFQSHTGAAAVLSGTVVYRVLCFKKAEKI